MLSWHNYLIVNGRTVSNKIMMWSATHFPAAMKSLNPSTRAKAIEIANDLLSRGGMDKHAVIATSIDEARKWARRGYMTEQNGAYIPRRL